MERQAHPPSDWVRESTAVSDEHDPSPAYGYWWWTYRDDELGDYFAARGNKGQFIVVIPSAMWSSSATAGISEV